TTGLDAARAAPLPLWSFVGTPHPVAFTARQDAQRDCRLSFLFAHERLPRACRLASWHVAGAMVSRASGAGRARAADALATQLALVAQTTATRLRLVPHALELCRLGAHFDGAHGGELVARNRAARTAPGGLRLEARQVACERR